MGKRKDIPTRLTFNDQVYDLYLIVPDDGKHFAYYLNKEESDETVNTKLYCFERNRESRLCSDNFFAASDLEASIQELLEKKIAGETEFQGYYISEDLQFTLQERMKEC